jgi:hypothetical protein
MYGTILLLSAMVLQQLIVDVHRIEVHQADPVDAANFLQPAQ